MSNIIKNVFFHAIMDCSNLNPVGKFFYGFADFDMDVDIKAQILAMIEHGQHFAGFDQCRVSNFQLTSFTPMPEQREPEQEVKSQVDGQAKGNGLLDWVSCRITGDSPCFPLLEYVDKNVEAGVQRKIAYEMLTRLCWVINYGDNMDNLQCQITNLMVELQNFKQQIRDDISEADES